MLLYKCKHILILFFLVIVLPFPYNILYIKGKLFFLRESYFIL